MDEIEKYYNKFNEDKRLNSRHGIVEYTISMEYIKKYIGDKKVKVLDIGAGTGKYSIDLANHGHDVTAVEYVKKNISVLQQKSSKVKTIHGNAINLKKIMDNSFDVVILFGPMYHLFTSEERFMALSEAKRVLKPNGVLFVAYLLSNYAFIRHAIMDNFLRENIKLGKIDKNFNIITTPKDLYYYTNLVEIKKLNKKCGLNRLKIISPDGPTDYIRQYVNKLSEEDFKLYIDFQRKNCERKDLIGASSHVVDILTKNA